MLRRATAQGTEGMGRKYFVNFAKDGALKMLASRCPDAWSLWCALSQATDELLGKERPQKKYVPAECQCTLKALEVVGRSPKTGDWRAD